MQAKLNFGDVSDDYPLILISNSKWLQGLLCVAYVLYLPS